MRISVVIPNYNYGRFLGLAINSLLEQTEAVDEIIVVDDGSTDNSREVMAGYGDRIIPIYQQNAGQASAFNAGVAKATGDIIALLDSDDLFFPDKVAQLKQLYASHPEVQWIFHNLQEFGQDSLPSPLPSQITKPTYQVVNEKQSMKRGTSYYDAPATSGLTFRSEFIKQIFPLPIADSITISDHYIKFYCLAKAEGLHIDAALGGQIVHGNNLYTGQKATATRARIFINTALELRRRLPEMRLFCENVFAEGLACALQTNTKKQLQSKVEEFCSVLSSSRKLFLICKAYLKMTLFCLKK